MSALLLLGLLVFAIWLTATLLRAPDDAGSLRKPGAAARHRAWTAAQSDECKMAVHECGHAVAAWCCTAVSAIGGITMERETGGGVLYTFVFKMGSVADSHWCDTVISLAGIAAEVHTYGRCRGGPARTDLSKAREAARELVKLGSPSPPWGKSKHLNVLPFDKVWEDAPSAAEVAILSQAYRMARDIVKAHGHSFYRLVSVLLTRKTVTEKEAAVVLGRRPKRLVGLLRPTFLMPHGGLEKAA